MKLKKTLSLFAQMAWMLSGARRLATVLLAVMLTMTAQTAWADDIIYVSTNGSDENDGSSEATALATIGKAVEYANDGETISIMNGEYTVTSKIDIGTKQLTFTGESQEGVIIKSGDNDLFYTTGSEGASLVISGLTFKDISMTGARVPIFIGGNDNVEITDCTFDNCASRYGALRIFTSGTVTVDNCKFLGTKSSNGSYSSAIEFDGNSTSDWIISNTVIDGSSISTSSTASYIFGAIYNQKTDGTVILDNVTIRNCDLGKANGLIATKGNMAIKNSTLVDNYVYRDYPDNLSMSGFIFVSGAKAVTIETSIIQNNTQPNYFLTSNSPLATFDLNYNNIQGNTFNNAFTISNVECTLEANYWGSNDLPEGVEAITWVVYNDGNYELNNGSPLDKEIPGLAYIITQDNFYNFFDEYGTLLNTVTSDELTFQGEFSNLAPIITIGRALTLTGDDAVLNNMALRITSDDVTVTGFTLNEDGADFGSNGGAAIYVNGSDVTLDNVSVTYNAPNGVEAKAIFANGADNFKLINSEIIFTGADPGSNHYRGLEVRDCDETIIDNNTISAEFPVVDVDYTKGWGTIDPDLVLAVGIQGGDGVEFTNNIVNVNTNGSVGSYPTIDAVMIYSANDILIKGNNITLLDTTTPTENSKGFYYYCLDIHSPNGIVEANDITVNTTTAGDVVRAGNAYAIQVTDPSEFTIKDNNLTGISKGPIAAIYASHWSGETKLTVENNIIDVTGYTNTNNSWDFVAGIGADIKKFKAQNNTITVANGADYDDAKPIYGICTVSSYDESIANIQDNNITVDGKYAVYYPYQTEITAIVTGNALCAHELTGDDAVYIAEGVENTVENNFLGYVMPKTGKRTYDIPANVSSFKVYDNGGMGLKYSPGCDGTLTLTAPEGYRLQLSGNIKTETGFDYLTVYDGSSNEAAKLIDQVSSSDSNGAETAIPTVISSGRSLTLYFCSNSSDSDDSEFDGLDLTVTVIYNLNETDGITTADVENLKGKLAVFSRTFTKGVTSTICLPFPMTSLSGGMLYGFQDVAYDETEGAWVADFRDMEAITVAFPSVAGMPYLFVADAEEEGDVTVLFSGTVPDDFDGTPGTGTAGVGDVWTLHGTYTQLTYGTDALNGYVYGFAGQAYEANSISAGNFVKLGGTAYVPPFRCYLTYSEGEFTGAPSMSGKAGTEMPNRIIVRLLGKDGTVTAIGTMDTKTGNVTFGDEWYSFDGRRVQGQPTLKGVYVNNGKKVVIK